MKPFLILAALALPFPIASAADSYTVDPEHTYANFEIGHLGFSTQRGRFDHTEGKITLDTEAKSGSVDITIDAKSIDTGLDELEKQLRGGEFFKVAKYPTLTFKSNTLRFDGDRLVGVDGEFTMLGVTKPLSLKVTSFKCGRHVVQIHRHACGADAVATIRRSEFGMTHYLPWVSDEVKLLISVEALRN